LSGLIDAVIKGLGVTFVVALRDAGARVLLIGTGQHAEGSGLDALPAVERSIRDLGDVLIDRCGLTWDRLRIVLDATTPTEIGMALAEEAERATSVLFVYYVGHGEPPGQGTKTGHYGVEVGRHHILTWLPANTQAPQPESCSLPRLSARWR
jgi:hypothetical protein